MINNLKHTRTQIRKQKQKYVKHPCYVVKEYNFLFIVNIPKVDYLKGY